MGIDFPANDEERRASLEPPFTWECPYCGRRTTVTGADFAQNSVSLHAPSSETIPPLLGVYGRMRYIRCPNPECRNRVLELWLCDLTTGSKIGDTLMLRRLIPQSAAKVFPSYVPESILSDYQEACLIVDLSPKASATLARRCLQGMVRHRWKIEGVRTLKEEIEAIRSDVDPLTWKAIDSVRSIGNIGAHMSRDVNIIVEVEVDEATLLISLIERLIHDWYIVPFERERETNSLVSLAASKGASA